jgi:hypothetical protein
MKVMKWPRLSVWTIFALAAIAVSAVAGWSQTCGDLNATMNAEDLGYAHRLLVLRNKEVKASTQLQKCIRGCGSNIAATDTTALHKCQTECQDVHTVQTNEIDKERDDANAEHQNARDKIQFDYKFKCGSKGKGAPVQSAPSAEPSS